MPHIEAFEQGLDQKKPQVDSIKIRWWNVKRRVYRSWLIKDYFTHTIRDPSVWVFEERWKNYLALFLSSFFALTFLLFPLGLLYFWMLSISSLYDLLYLIGVGGAFFPITYFLAALLLNNAYNQWFRFKSTKKLTLDRQSRLLVWELKPWLMKDSKHQIPLSSFTTRIIQRSSSDYRKIHIVRGETEFAAFDLYRSVDRTKVRKFWSNLSTFLQKA
ncbi:MAG: hypothetical protein ACFFFG_15880 [Candidatus Thorarchaeota archaeon]